jgi:hypothetical protein
VILVIKFEFFWVKFYTILGFNFLAPCDFDRCVRILKQLQWIGMIHMHFFTLTTQTHKKGGYCNFEQKYLNHGFIKWLKLVLEVLLFLKCIICVFMKITFQWHFLKFPPSSFPQTRKHIILPIWGFITFNNASNLNMHYII